LDKKSAVAWFYLIMLLLVTFLCGALVGGYAVSNSLLRCLVCKTIKPRTVWVCPACKEKVLKADTDK